jgi:DeoR family deoxyribose operon repressor
MIRRDNVEKNQRVKEITNLLKWKNAVSIKELKNKLGVSEMTVRRDLDMLAGDGIIEIIPGGAIFKSPHPASENEKYFISREETVNTVEKIKIGQRAALLIEPNETVIIDMGSTTENIAKFMREDVPVTTLCFALNILVELYRKRNCRIIFAGGYYHEETMMFDSPEGIALVSRTRADKVFVSAAGVHIDLGITSIYQYELQMKKTIMSSAKSRILVADSSKFGKTKNAYFADLKEFDVIVTDAGVSGDYAKAIRDAGIELITA